MTAGGRTLLRRVDMHTHTEFSPDSRTKLAAFAAAAADAGLDAVCVTDHDTVEGALRLREIAAAVRVIVGEEISTKDGEIIGLFLEAAVPRALPAEETIARIHDQGGIVYVPHPFSRNRRNHIRFSALQRIAGTLDAMEVFNAREAFAGDNRRALAFAARHAIAGGAGSDAHRSSELGRAYVELDRDFATPTEFVTALRSGRVAGRLSGVTVHVGTRYDVIRKWLRRRRRPAEGR